MISPTEHAAQRPQLPQLGHVQDHYARTSGVGYQVGKVRPPDQTMNTERIQLAGGSARTAVRGGQGEFSVDLLTEADQVYLPGAAARRSAARLPVRPGYETALAAGPAERLRRPAACSLTRRLVAYPPRQVRDRGQITGLDQLVRLEPRERARARDP
jgi:hypothetical protein